MSLLHGISVAAVVKSVVQPSAAQFGMAIVLTLISLIIWDVRRAGGLANWLTGLEEPATVWRRYRALGRASRKRRRGARRKS